MARSRLRQTRKQSRLELLPVELQSIILRNVASTDDLASLIIASRSYHATYLHYKKTILAQVTQATLGDLFLDGCMLQHWQGNLNSYTGDQDDGEGSVMLHNWHSNLGSCGPTENEGDRVKSTHIFDTQPWPRGPYRHIQLKFLHDYDQQAMADDDAQARHVWKLLTADDFSRILTFHARVVRPLSELFAESYRVRTHSITNYGQGDTIPEPPRVTETERQRIMQTLYRVQLCCRLYGPKSTPEEKGTIDLGQSHRLAMAGDFFSRLDMLEKEEILFAYRMLSLELQGYFSLVRHDQDWKEVLRQRCRHAGNLRWIDYHPITMEPVGALGVNAGVLSIGLELFMRMGSATSPGEIAAALVASDPPDLRNFVFETLAGLREAHNFKWGWPESWSDEFWQ